MLLLVSPDNESIVMKLVTFAALGRSCCHGAFSSYRSYNRRRDLEERLQWMDLTYNPHKGRNDLRQGNASCTGSN